MRKEFILGIIQDTPYISNFFKNMLMMEEYILEATQKNVSLLVFPELFITGYITESWINSLTPENEQEWHQKMHAMCKMNNISVIYGHPSFHPNNAPLDLVKNPHFEVPLYNAATLISPKGIVGTYAKTHLFSDESAVFTAGNGFPIWDTEFGRISVQICYDLEFPECARVAALAGADLLIYPANNMYPFGEFHRCYTMARAMENNLFVISVNRVGSEGNIDFCGCSCIAHPNGTYLMSIGNEKGLFTCVINPSDRLKLHKDLHYFENRRPELYGELTNS